MLLLEAGPDYQTMDDLPMEIKLGYGFDRNIWARAFGKDSKHNWNFVAKSNDLFPDMMVPQRQTRRWVQLGERADLPARHARGLR